MKCPECAEMMETYDQEQICPYCGHVELKELDFNNEIYDDPRGDEECQ